MSNKFGGGTADNISLNDGSAELIVNSITIDSLVANKPLKTNGNKEIITTNLEVADVTGLQGLLDGKIANVPVQEEGGAVLNATTLNFVGDNVTATDGGAGVATITVSGGGGIAVQEEGSTIVASATTVNFVGKGSTVTDVGGVATVTVPSFRWEERFYRLDVPFTPSWQFMQVDTSTGTDPINCYEFFEDFTITRFWLGDDNGLGVEYDVQVRINDIIDSTLSFAPVDCTNGGAQIHVLLGAPLLMTAGDVIAFRIQATTVGGNTEVLMKFGGHPT